jgi:polyhydroxyalkanoate synthase
MSGAFSMLRSNDLIWSRVIDDYLLGKRRSINDIIAWDYDTTRLPYRMHSEYLHNLSLNNDLVQGRYNVGKRRIALTDIKIPIFVVATVKDHVSPWRSVYKINLFTNTDITFVLTSGGHNAGIVSEPGHKNRTYQINSRKAGDRYVSSDTWLEKYIKHEGSWWLEWNNWLAVQTSEKTSPPEMGNPKKDHNTICDAPGTYVLQK